MNDQVSAKELKMYIIEWCDSNGVNHRVEVRMASCSAAHILAATLADESVPVVRELALEKYA